MYVYVLIANVYEGDYGVEMHLFGVFDTEELAEEKAKELDLSMYEIIETKVNQSINEYIGGYIE